jgi:hypothetical protein
MKANLCFIEIEDKIGSRFSGGFRDAPSSVSLRQNASSPSHTSSIFFGLWRRMRQ